MNLLVVTRGRWWTLDSGGKVMDVLHHIAADLLGWGKAAAGGYQAPSVIIWEARFHIVCWLATWAPNSTA